MYYRLQKIDNLRKKQIYVKKGKNLQVLHNNSYTIGTEWLLCFINQIGK